MAERPRWDEKQLRAVALAYRNARKRGLPDHAFEASLRVAVHCFPEAQDHKMIVAAMLLEAVQRWGGWLAGDDEYGPDGASNDNPTPD